MNILLLGVSAKDHWMEVFIAVVLTSLFEAFTTQIDNIVLPLFMFILLI